MELDVLAKKGCWYHKWGPLKMALCSGTLKLIVKLYTLFNIQDPELLNLSCINLLRPNNEVSCARPRFACKVEMNLVSEASGEKN